MCVVEVKNLFKSFGDVHVLNGISITVEKGSVFALLGSNGAGKTTTIKILSTLMKPDSGNALLSGIDVVKKPRAVKKHIALTGQYAAVDEVLTGRENLRMIGNLLRVSDYKKKAERLLNQFDLIESADRKVSTYSGGMKRKIDIAMSLMGNPSVIFLDEPTTGLDPQSRKAMWKMIKGLTSTGVTIFLTTQYLEEAEVLADKIAILDHGNIIAEGTSDELKNIIDSDIITLTFASKLDAKKAGLTLSDYQPRVALDSYEVVIEVHGSVSEIFRIHEKLSATGIVIKNFEKKRATLEDVFLEIISKEQKRGEMNALSG